MSRKTPEGRFKEELYDDLNRLFPGCVILKNDEQLCQGIPDMLVLYKTHWAMLEAKAYQGADHQPNQDYYVDLFHEMSYAAFIYPENKESVLRELQLAFGTRRASRVSKRQ